MRCPFCKDDGTKSKVIDSRESGGGSQIRRRRECEACGRRYTTYERVEEPPLKVVKRDGTRQAFDRDKIVRRLDSVCLKRKISDERLEQLVSDVEREIGEVHDREVPSVFIGELMMRKLRELDMVAYVRYASAYRDFDDVSDFIDQLRPLLGGDG